MIESKLYYQEPYKKEFTTRLKSQMKDEDGNWYVLLHATTFYPTGGGQPFDTGTLNGCRVVNVEEVDGEIRHYLSQKLEQEPGSEVEGKIDWSRRFDHMQQHAGQHILSAAFVETTGYETISFHLGKDLLTIDLNTEEISQQQIEQVEDLANSIILENRPIDTIWVTQEEINKYPLRKKLSVSENIRLVIIPDFDYNGCGGTHPSSTGAVSVIKILDWERQKNKTRVYFVCGNRVRNQLHVKHHILKEVGQLVSSSESLLVNTIQHLLIKNSEGEKEKANLKEQLLHFEARELVQTHEEKNIVSNVFQNRSIQELQKLARLIVAENEDAVVLLVTENDQQLQLVFAKGTNSHTNMKELVKEVLPIINGKGGGNESQAQGGGERTVSGEELVKNTISKLGL
ncbi:alanyl-tRNA editing protein [Bacillus pinisoli]|uniref:alanyl-tRNA editing protein n=1 Tax=Bacillus pinisoli TaxID=2901866 RepID=UPI001FF48E79|nr:DHHA1 domain-containing protein [Bacillus pinisoli]